MLREDMVECAALIGKAMGLCEFGYGDKAGIPLQQALDLLQKAPNEERQAAAERQRKSRAIRAVAKRDGHGASQDVTVTGRDRLTDTRDPKGEVVEEEVEAEEGETRAIAGRLVERMSQIAGIAFTIDPNVNLAVVALSDEIGEVDAEARLLAMVEDFRRWADDPKMRRRYNPATLFGGKWRARVDEVRLADGDGGSTPSDATAVMQAAVDCERCQPPSVYCARHGDAGMDVPLAVWWPFLAAIERDAEAVS